MKSNIRFHFFCYPLFRNNNITKIGETFLSELTLEGINAKYINDKISININVIISFSILLLLHCQKCLFLFFLETTYISSVLEQVDYWSISYINVKIRLENYFSIMKLSNRTVFNYNKNKWPWKRDTMWFDSKFNIFFGHIGHNREWNNQISSLSSLLRKKPTPHFRFYSLWPWNRQFRGMCFSRHINISL